MSSIVGPTIRLSGPIEWDNIVNGDGLRAVIWTQGCFSHCEGCQNPETWDPEAGFLVLLQIVLPHQERVPCYRLEKFRKWYQNFFLVAAS